MAILALPFPASVTVIVTFAVFTKFNCLLDNVDPLFCETRTVLAAEIIALEVTLPPIVKSPRTSNVLAVSFPLTMASAPTSKIVPDVLFKRIVPSERVKLPIPLV